MKANKLILSVYFLVATCFYCVAQDMLVATKVSPKASVMQRIGTTDVTVTYSSPSAKNRKIFGGIVPFDFKVDGVEYPWRAGSNENTTISFTHDVTIQGEPLPKGTYGLHIYVKEKEWIFIFSKDSEKWGSFSYDKNEDALRVSAIPEKNTYQEWLNYEFVSRKPSIARLELQWSTLKCGIDIGTDVTANVLADLMAKEEKKVDDYIKLAQLCMAQDAENIDKALGYVETSLGIGEEFRNLMLKSQLLSQKGMTEESEAIKERALAKGVGFPYFYYYPLSFMMLDGDMKKTFELLSSMLTKEPNNWIANLAMGEYYIKAQHQEKATYHFGKAYEFAGERSKRYTQYMYESNQLILDRM